MPEDSSSNIAPLTLQRLTQFLKTLIIGEEMSGKFYTPNMDCRIEIQKYFPSGTSDAVLTHYLKRLVSMHFLSLNCGPMGLKIVGYCTTSKSVALVETELTPQFRYYQAIDEKSVENLKIISEKVKQSSLKKTVSMIKVFAPQTMSIDFVKATLDKRVVEAEASLDIVKDKLDTVRKQIAQKEKALLRLAATDRQISSEHIVNGLRIREKILSRLVNEESERLGRLKSA